MSGEVIPYLGYESLR